MRLVVVLGSGQLMIMPVRVVVMVVAVRLVVVVVVRVGRCMECKAGSGALSP